MNSQVSVFVQFVTYGGAYTRGVPLDGVGVADATGDADGVSGLVLEEAVFLVPAIAPPMIAAATTRAKITANIIQKFRRRRPHIFRRLSSGGGIGTIFAIAFVFISAS